MTIWHVMKTYNEESVYYQTLPYDVRIIYNLLQLKNGVWQTLIFLRNSRWMQKRACILVERKIMRYKKHQNMHIQ